MINRLPKGTKYYHLDIDLEVIGWYEAGDKVDEDCFKAGNYFVTKQQAEKAGNAIKLLLNKYAS